MNWSNRDWKWLSGILVAIIICVLTFRLSDNQNVNDMFSFVASAVSIALAFVAIGMAVKQDVENRRVQDNLNGILTGLQNKMETMNDAVQKITTEDVLSRVIEETDKLIETETKDTFSKQEVNKLVTNSLLDYDKSLLEKLEYIRNKEANEELNRIYGIDNKPLRDKLTKVQILNTFDQNKELSLAEIANKHNVSVAYVARILRETSEKIEV